MKLDKIELDLCVNVVPYPHEEIEALNYAVKAHEEQRQKYYKLWCNSLDDVRQERALSNQTLMVAQAWKKKFEELENTCKETEKELSSTTLLYEAYQDNYELLGEKYNKLLESHAKVLEENVKCQNNANIDLDNFSDLLAQHVKLQDKYEGALQELSAVKLIINTGVMTWKSEI